MIDIDRLPKPARDLALLLVMALLSWAGTDLVPWIERHPGWGALVGALVTALVAYVSPLVKSYGLFQDGRQEATGGRTEGVDTGPAA